MRKLFLSVVVAVLAFASPAVAADLDQNIKNIDGSDILGQDGKPLGLTMALAIQNALLSEQTSNEVEKGKNYALAVKVITNAKNFIPDADDVVRIRKAMGATQATLVYGQVMTVIDATFAAAQQPAKK